jgi:cell division protein FtsZ
MARRSNKRASLREGPLADLFRATVDDVDEAKPAKNAPRRAANGKSAKTNEPALDIVPQAPEIPDPEHVKAYRVAPEEESVGLDSPPGGVPSAKEKLRALYAEDEADIRRAPHPGRIAGTPKAHLPIIRVVGVGGGGTNAVNRMVEAELPGIEFMAINTDMQSLQTSNADITVHIGTEATKGLGTGGDQDMGYEAAFADQDKIKRLLKGSDMVFVTAGEGGGTGTGAAPVVAKLARDVGALTLGIVTTPFKFEGPRRATAAKKGIKALAEEVDTLIVVPNDRLIKVLDRQTSMMEAFRVADDVLRQGVQGIAELVTLPGLINLDFADVRTIMDEAGPAVLGIGMSSGDNRATYAAEKAVSSPLLETSMKGARSILLSVTGGRDLSLIEVSEAAKMVQDWAHPDADIIFGANVDEDLDEQVWVTVIATRFDAARESLQALRKRRSQAGAKAAETRKAAAAKRSAAAKKAAASRKAADTKSRTTAARPAASKPKRARPKKNGPSNGAVTRRRRTRDVAPESREIEDDLFPF